MNKEQATTFKIIFLFIVALTSMILLVVIPHLLNNNLL